MRFKRKSNRLESSFYKQKGVYFLTLCCFNGKSIFTSESIVNSMLETLESCCNDYGLKNLAYCFMPNHLHLLLEGEEDSNLIGMVKKFKQLTGYHFKKDTGDNLWQKSFYDHILRKEEDIVNIIRYILENPVRKGLVSQPSEYVYSGSLQFGKGVFKM